MATNSVTLDDYVGLNPSWCPGCGNFGILQAVNRALVEMDIKPHQVLMVSGIGQAGKLPHYTRGNIFNSLHGRTLPPAVGAKIANPELTVIAVGGDGDGYGEGGNHLLHSARRNHDITYLVHDNQIYGLTKGQASPTSDEGFITRTTPQGAPPPLNPVALAIIAGASFVARGFAGDIEHLSRLIKQAIRHRGFAIIDILQPCVSFNRKNTFKWYRNRVYRLDDNSYDPGSKKRALDKALEWGRKIPTGVMYKKERPTFEEQIPALTKGPLVKQPFNPERVEQLFRDFR